MIVNSETRVIPERVIETISYIAQDGKVFTNQDACLKYEKYLELINHEVFKTAQKVSTWPDDYCATLYYISSEVQYEYLKKGLNIEYFDSDDYEDYGPGYYLFIQEDMGDSPAKYYLHSLTRYLETSEFEFEAWKADIQSAVLRESQVREELKLN